MPPVSRPRLAAVAELAERLAAMPVGERLAAADAAEVVAREIEPDSLYPEDWLVWRLTGVTARVRQPRMLVGSAVLADLSSLVERATDGAEEEGSGAGDSSLGVEELMARWGVSRATLDRYRRLGLIARRVDLGGGRRGLRFSMATVEAFEHAHAEKLQRAREFARTDAATTARIERRARRYAACGLSLSQAAGRVATRFDLSHEGARQLLMRAKDGAGSAVFAARGPATRRERGVFWRALRRGIEPGEIAARFGVGKPAVVRGALQHRVRLLKELAERGELARPVAVTFERDDAAEVLLGSALVREGPVVEGWAAELPSRIGALLALSRASRALPAGDEAIVASAMQFLCFRAARVIEGLREAGPEAGAIEEAERDLRWALMLKGVLVRSALGAALAAAESRVGGPIERLAEGLALRVAGRMVAAASEAASGFDAAHGGRLAARVSRAVDRAIAPIVPSPGASPSLAGADGEGPTREGRAARVLRGDAELPRVLLEPWEVILAADPRVRAAALAPVDASDEGSAVGTRAAWLGRCVVVDRHGLAGQAPRTLAEAAANAGVAVMHAGRAERAFVRAALTRARADG